MQAKACTIYKSQQDQHVSGYVGNNHQIRKEPDFLNKGNRSLYLDRFNHC